MGMEFAPTCLRQVSPLLHMTTLTTVNRVIQKLLTRCFEISWNGWT